MRIDAFLKATLLLITALSVIKGQSPADRIVIESDRRVPAVMRAAGSSAANHSARINATLPAQQSGGTNPLNIANVLDYGATGQNPGKDAPAIRMAIEAVAKRGGGTILFPAGYEFVCDTPLILDNKIAVHFVGAGGGRGGIPTLRYTGTGDLFISLRQTRGIEFRNLNIIATNPNFRGTLIKTGKLPPIDGSPGDDSLVIEGCQLAATNINNVKALLSLEWVTNGTVRGNKLYGANYAILGRERGNDSGFSIAVLIDNNIFIDQTIASVKNAGENWKITNNSAEPIKGMAGFYAQDVNYYAYQLSLTGNWLGDVTASGGAYITTRAVGLEIAGNVFYFGTGAAGDAINLTGCDGVSITGNQFFGNAATGINFNNITSNGVHVAGNNLSVGKPIANLGNINGHAFLGNNVGGTPLSNSVSNDLTVKTDLTVGGNVVGNNDNVALGLSYGGVGLGFVKKAGAAPFIGFGRGHNFSIAQSNTSDVTAKQTFTPLLIVNETGTSIAGRVSVERNGTGDIEVGRFSGAGGRSYITLGTGQTANTGGYVLYDPSVQRMQLGVHGSALNLAVDGNGNASLPGRLSSGSLIVGTGGARISKVLRATATLDFPAVGGFSAADLTVPVSGATAGDIVSLGLPGAAMPAAAPLAFTAWVSANDVVTIRLTNAQAGSVDVPRASYSVMVTKF